MSKEFLDAFADLRKEKMKPVTKEIAVKTIGKITEHQMSESM